MALPNPISTDTKEALPIAASNSNGQLDCLTGLRFFAAIVVLIGHLTGDTNGNGFGKFGLPKVEVMLGGAAVSFFFVLSGFILTYVYQGKLTYSGIKNFYIKRWARIWPLHVVCLLLFVYSLDVHIHNWKVFITNFTLLQSWVPNTKWAFSFNGVSWSISTEMFFYLMFPFLLLGGEKRFWIKFLLIWFAVTLTVFGIQALDKNPQWLGYDFSSWEFARAAQVNPFLRLAEFSTGMAVGFVYLRRHHNRRQRLAIVDTLFEILALSLIPLFYWLFWHPFHLRHWIQTAAWGGGVLTTWIQYGPGLVLAFAAIVYVFSRSNGYLSKILGSRALVFGGEISFAIYMIHYYVILRYEQLDWSASEYSVLLLATSIALVTFCLATLLYKLVELPAKSGLISLFQGDYRKAIQQLASQWFAFLKSPLFFGTLLLLAASFGTARLSYTPILRTAQINDVVSESSHSNRNVEFGDTIRLKGVKAHPISKGIAVEIVWQKLKPLNQIRFVHFCDSNGKVVSQLAPPQDVLNEAEIKQFCVDEIVLPTEMIKDSRVAFIGIGFIEKKQDRVPNEFPKMLPVSKGPRGMANFRLHVIETEELKRLTMLGDIRCDL